MTLSGRRVVVVGGTSGMGLGAVRAAASAGAEVIAAGRRTAAERGAVESGDHPVRQLVLDVTDEKAVRKAFEDIGKLDHLFVTATPKAPSEPFFDQDVAAARQFMNGKFFGSWACARYAAPRMPAGGSITFLTGCASIRPPRARPPGPFHSCRRLRRRAARGAIDRPSCGRDHFLVSSNPP